MASVNKVILVGHLGRDPEMRYLPSGEAVANLSLATSESWKDKNTGEKMEATEWHRVSLFGKLADVSGQYLKKGSMVYIEGSLRTRKWQDKDGQDRYTTEIRGDKLTMLGGKEGGAGAREAQPTSSTGGDGGGGGARSANAGQGGGDFDDDIPFASASPSMDPMFRRHPALGWPA